MMTGTNNYKPNNTLEDKKYSDKINSDTLHDVRIITFNLLSPEFALDEYYPFVRKTHLDFHNRVEKTKQLMRSWMKVNFIICVQEMSIQWKKELGAFFADNKYGFCGDVYSGEKMGIGIAYPLQHYELLVVDKFSCGDYINTIYEKLEKLNDDNDKKKLSDEKNEQEVLRLDLRLKKIDELISPTKKTIINKDLLTELQYATESKNIMLSVLLKAKYFGNDIKKNLIVSTYHMPCRFKYKYYLAAHIHALKMHVRDLTAYWNELYGSTLSSVLAGDFNIIANSPLYNLLTGQYNDFNESKKDQESNTIFVEMTNVYALVSENLFGGAQLRSTHKTLHTKEPNYTNVNLQEETRFIECLDYILINENIDIRSCRVGLTVTNPEVTPYPNGLCPSDHLPLSASLRIR
jgi:mRNA deadenylase 3'-5' endonuclease subunit Ccr4